MRGTSGSPFFIEKISMKTEHWKIISLIVLGISMIVILFLVAFYFFKPERKETKVVTDSTTVSDDPASLLYVSEDGGITWRGISGGKVTPFHIEFDIASSRLLIGTQENSLWYANSAKLDTVLQFNASSALPSDATIYDIALQKEGAKVYLATHRDDRGFVVEFSDSTARELFFMPLTDTSVRSVVVDPFAKNSLLVSAGNVLYISENAGETWQIAFRFKQEIAHMVANSHASGEYFVTTRRGEFFRSSDYGETWKDLTRGFSKLKGSRDNQQVYVDAGTGIVYLASKHGLLASRDTGDTWQDIPLIVPPDSLPISGFAAHPTNHNILYISAASQLYKSLDGGITWKGILFSDKGSITSIAIDSLHPNIVLIGFAPKKRF